MSATILRAEHLLELGRTEAAREEVVRHLAGAPDDADALRLLARCHLALGENREAWDAARAALAIEPDDSWTHRLLCIAASDLSQHKAALVHGREAVRLDPEDWLCRTTLSAAYVAARQVRKAHDQARRAVELAPDEAQAHLQLSIAAEARRLRGEADRALRRALELAPDSPDVLHYRARLQLERGNLASGAQSAVGALRADPDSAFGQASLHVLMHQLVVRLYCVSLLGGLALSGVLALDIEGHVPAYWPRALAGAVLLAAIAGTVELTLRHVPALTRRHLVGLARSWRGLRLVAPVGLALAGLAVLAMAFLPTTLASYGTLVAWGLIYLGKLLFFGLLVVRGVLLVRALVGRR